MREVLGAFFFGGIATAGYVFVHGLDRTYQMFGEAGISLSGAEAMLGSLCLIAGVAFFYVGTIEELREVKPGDEESEWETVRTYDSFLIITGLALASVTLFVLVRGQ